MRYKFLATLPLLLMLVIYREAVAQGLPHDYTVTTEGGQYVFVMLANIPNGEPVTSIRSHYARSGLYQNNGSKNPLWTVNWFAPSVNISADGQHLVAWDRQFSNSQQDPVALVFYEQGRSIASYRVDQLVTFPLLPPGHGCCHWQTDRSFDDKQGRLSIQNREGEQLVFDVRTGGVSTGFIPPISRFLIIGGALLLTGLITVYLRIVLRRNPWREPLINKWAAPRPLI